MANNTSLETQYSLYKINYEAVEANFNNIPHDSNAEAYADNVINTLLENIIRNIRRKQFSKVQTVVCQGFKGVIFKTTHFPMWQSVALDFLENNEVADGESIFSRDTLTNTNVSYIYFYRHNENV